MDNSVVIAGRGRGYERDKGNEKKYNTNKLEKKKPLVTSSLKYFSPLKHFKITA